MLYQYQRQYQIFVFQQYNVLINLLMYIDWFIIYIIIFDYLWHKDFMWEDNKIQCIQNQKELMVFFQTQHTILQLQSLPKNQCISFIEVLIIYIFVKCIYLQFYNKIQKNKICQPKNGYLFIQQINLYINQIFRLKRYILGLFSIANIIIYNLFDIYIRFNNNQYVSYVIYFLNSNNVLNDGFSRKFFFYRVQHFLTFFM
eukprot:TRINITY_DN8353_c0_g1_i3.p1 TRINITY_DN8353_c0_g1~~TRINITY_DN8353_c0_g1_i3.p1  ORF type:complete len:200 (-),score=-19.36 TRINITY_DN8353_c0_g1_i3:411-1010(-)